MTAPFAPPADREHIIRAGHHPLAFCEFCGQRVATPTTPCPDLICQLLWRHLLHVMQRAGGGPQ